MTIGKLSDEVLLNIFRYSLDASPRFWSSLVHICRKWRHIVFASQRALHLRLFCMHGTPVLKTLDHWPALPIVVQYGGSLALDPLAPEDEENIMAALRQSDRVGSISLTVTNSLLENLSTISEPFLELEELVLLPRDNMQLTLPSAFRWGPRLRCLHSTRVAFPALLQLLYSSRNLVDLQLHEVFDPWHVSPEALTDALSGMAQLRSLSLHFLPTAYYPAPSPRSRRRVVLPVLTHLNFRGIAQYLEDIVARIDAPRLGYIEVTFFNKIIIDLSKLSEFINRVEMHKSYRRAHILSSERAISISLIQPGAPACLKLQLFCESLSGQLFSMARICIHFSDFLFNVEDLRISATRPPRWNNSLYSGHWLELISSFTGVKWFHVAGNLSTNVVRALRPPDRRREIVLPALHRLYIPQPGQRHAPLREAVVSFITSRRLSGHPIWVEYEPLCHISELRRTGTTEVLSNDIPLNVFCHYLDATPRFLPTLAYLCQRLRQIGSTSPLGLKNLRLHCTHRTPVLETLDFWPALPIVVEYGGFPALDPPAPEDEDNIMVALKQSSRVSSISLTVTSSLRERVHAIEGPFSEQEDLVLLSQDGVRPTLPSTFRWGPRLRNLHLTRIAFPALPRRLDFSRDLVDIQLHEIPSIGYFSPKSFRNALSQMTQLQSISLHFLSAADYIGFHSPSGKRVVLPILTCLKYRGISEYLDSLMARIDASRLGDIEITFFNEITFDVSNLSDFIDWIAMQKSHRQADILFSERSVSISSTQPAPTCLKLQVFCEPLSQQLFSIAQICSRFSALLFCVEDLRIKLTRLSSRQDGSERWLEVIRSFGGTKWFHVAGDFSIDIVLALHKSGKRRRTVIPAMHKLCIREPEPHCAPLRTAVVSFMVSRRLSGHFIGVEYERLWINELREIGIT